MKFIRSIITTFCFIIFGIGAIFLNFLIFPFIKQDKILCSKIIHNSWKFFTRFLSIVGLIGVDIKHLEKIENKVIVATHPSFIDIVILIGLIPKTTCFVKKELTKNFVMKNIVNSIFISNELEIEDMKKETKKMLDMGFNLIVFPTGSRHRKNEHPKIKKGAATIALNANKDIIPIEIISSEDFLFIHQPFYAAGKKRVIFEIEQLETIKIENFKQKTEIENKKELTKEIENKLYML